MYRLVLVACVCFLFGVRLHAQSGPGGIGSNDGSSNLSLWLDAGKINGISDGADIAGWSDVSGNNNHARISTNPPSFVAAGGGNGHPSVSFDNGNTEDLYVEGNNEVLPTNELTVFVIGNYENASDNWGAFVSASDDDAWNDGWGIAENGGTGNLMFYLDDYLANVCTQSASADYGTNHIWSLLFNTTDNTGYGYKSESSCSYAFNGPITYDGGGNNDLLIGSGPDNGGPNYYLNGDISEIILYDVALNDAQRIIISNYLAAKYNITLSNFDIYDEDDNGDYDYDVAGIGRVDASNIHNDSQGSGIVRFLNPTGLGDDEFLFWGHDNGDLEATETADVPAGTDARLDRVWRVSERNSANTTNINVGDTDIRFDLSDFTSVFAADLVLLIDDDNDGTFADESTISGATDLGNGIFEFAGVPGNAAGAGIRDNRRFTLGTTNSDQTTLFANDFSMTGPGGVGSTDGSSNLSLWLDANQLAGLNDGDDLTGWEDISGNNYHAQIGTNAPSYAATGGGNSFPSVSFDNVNTENLFITTNAEVMPVNEVSVFVMGNYENASDNWGGMISASNDDNWDDGWGIAQDNGTGNMMFYLDDYLNDVCIQDASVDYGTNHVWSMIFNTTDNLGYGYKSESSCSFGFNGSLNYNVGVNEDLLIGAGPDNGGPNYFMNGDISEVIIYDVALNDAQRIIVTNYLAAKYALTLSANDVYDEDDNGDYDFEVAGIGRIDATNIHNAAQGTGIVQIDNPTGLGNNEFLMWGHDNVSLDNTEFSDVPSGVDARLARLWRVSEVNTGGTPVDVGAIDIIFHLGNQGFPNVDASDLVLLVDTDNDGLFDDEAAISAPTDLGGNSFEFSGVTAIADNLRFTVGTTDINSTPLPVELVYFDASHENGKVTLSWQTASELNNDFFTIERSTDGEVWENLKVIRGAGNSSESLEYEYLDSNPIAGVSYYRLKQTDFDGQFEYFETISVKIDLDLIKSYLYPNPSTDFIRLKVVENPSIQILDVSGKNVTDKVGKEREGSLLRFDISQLIEGTYFLKANEKSIRFIKN